MIQSLNRAFEIIRYVAAADDGIRLRELADLCGLKKTTVYNLAETLVEEGMLQKVADSRYMLGPMVTELYLLQRGHKNLPRLAAAMVELHKRYPIAGMVYAELGQNDIFARINLPSGTPGKVEYPDSVTLNPYWTVCGLLFFALMPDESLNGLRLRYPFEYIGIETWKSEAAWQQQVAQTKQNDWSETPHLVPPDYFKVGMPVRDCNGNLRGTLTFNGDRAALGSSDDELRTAVRATAEIMGRL